eukprot:s504_g13.t1
MASGTAVLKDIASRLEVLTVELLDASQASVPDALTQPSLELLGEQKQVLYDLIGSLSSAVSEETSVLEVEIAELVKHQLHELQIEGGPWHNPPALRRFREMGQAVSKKLQLLAQTRARPAPKQEPIVDRSSWRQSEGSLGAPAPSMAAPSPGNPFGATPARGRDHRYTVEEALNLLCEKKEPIWKGSLIGVVHAAGVQEMTAINSHLPGRFEFVYAPKVQAAHTSSLAGNRQEPAERGTGVGEADVAVVVAKAKALMEAKATDVEADIDDGFATKFLRHFHTPLQPFAAFLGGICAQEVVKVAGKFTPIPGWLHFNAVEALPDSPPADAAPQGSRYDSLAAVYGHSFVKKLQSLKYFMVGCGALGCEFLKNFALNGVCCGPDGLLTVTDADRIELSNLTRQFLFREHNVGQPKSKAATAMAQVMNPGMKVRALEMFVGPKTEEKSSFCYCFDSFNDEFWMSLDGVCNALDNMEARFYVDDQCVKYEKPLLESGTMGPAGNVDPVVPFKTQTYKDGGQADEGGGIPMCTLRNFPHLPDHCIEWARDQFELFFVKSVKQLKKFHEDPTAFISEIGTSTDLTQSIFEVRGLLSLLTAASAPSVRSAGQSAFDFFHLLFRDKILDLTAAFPATARIIDPETKQDKGAFWSGHKRFPQATTYDPENETHWRFLVSATALFAAMLGAVPVKAEGDNTWCQDMRSKGWAASLSKDLVLPQYVAGGVNMDGDTTAGDVTAGAKSDSKAILAGLLQQLEAFKDKPLPALEEADFEKDDDFNFHIEFITRCANLRADNYHIANSDFHKVKLVAGRIVPAIATTTAAVCGLVMLELFKLLLGKGTEGFRTRQVGLAVNTYTSFEAQEPKTFASGVEKKVPRAEDLPPDAFDSAGKIKAEYVVEEAYASYPEKHSVWDKIVVPTGTMTLEAFKGWLASEHKLQKPTIIWEGGIQQLGNRESSAVRTNRS